MKKTLVLLTFVFLFSFIKSQNMKNESTKFIEVTGSSEMEFEPDEVHLIIGIQEYWKEEFDKKLSLKSLKTKVEISQIEKDLRNVLSKIGISKEKITLKQVGNYWRYKGKESLINKQLELSLSNFDKFDQIIESIDLKGVNYLRIGELTHKNITEYRKQVKISALKAAKEKADYLLESIDKKRGDVISIIELENNNNYWFSQSQLSNKVMTNSDDSGIDNFKKIKLRYEIKVQFEIK